METYNTSVSPPSGTRQSLNPLDHRDRDEIKRWAEADFAKLYADHGGRCRGKAFYCLFHEDGTPSASGASDALPAISRSTSSSSSSASRGPISKALSYLSDRYDVPTRPWRLQPAERFRYARQYRDLEHDLPAALCWKAGHRSITNALGSLRAFPPMGAERGL